MKTRKLNDLIGQGYIRATVDGVEYRAKWNLNGTRPLDVVGVQGDRVVLLSKSVKEKVTKALRERQGGSWDEAYGGSDEDCYENDMCYP